MKDDKPFDYECDTSKWESYEDFKDPNFDWDAFGEKIIQEKNEIIKKIRVIEERWLLEKAKQLEEAVLMDPIQIAELQEICKEYAEKFIIK